MRFLMPPLPQDMAQGRPDTLDIVDQQQIPAHVRRHTDPIIAQLESLGFIHTFYYTVPVLGPQEGYVSACLGRDSRMVAAATYVRQRTAVVEMEQLYCALATQLNDGRIISTSNIMPTLNTPPNVEAVKLPGQAPEAVVSQHKQRIDQLQPAEIRPITTPNELAAFSLRMNQVEIDDFIQRGLYTLMSDAEVTAMRTQSLGTF